MLPQAEVTAVTLEFGTYSTIEVFAATRADNWLHCHGNPLGADAEDIKTEIRRVFYPDADDWKEMVWTRAREVIERAGPGLGGRSRPGPAAEAPTA
jgi:hypothetical protein